VQRERVFLGQRGDCIQFCERISRPGFGRLSNAERAHLRRVNVEMLAEYNRDCVEIEFPIFARNSEEFAASGKKFWRAAFVGVDVGAIMTDRALVWSAQLGERKRVRGGAVEDEKGFAVGLKNVAQLFLQLAGPTIGSVGNFGGAVGFEKRMARLGTDSRRVIAREVVAIGDRHSVP